MAKLIDFPAPRPEPDWWYAALDEFTPEERALVERTVATPSEMARLPLTAEEEEWAKEVIERYLQRERFRLL